MQGTTKQTDAAEGTIRLERDWREFALNMNAMKRPMAERFAVYAADTFNRPHTPEEARSVLFAWLEAELKEVQTVLMLLGRGPGASA